MPFHQICPFMKTFDRWLKLLMFYLKLEVWKWGESFQTYDSCRFKVGEIIIILLGSLGLVDSIPAYFERLVCRSESVLLKFVQPCGRHDNRSSRAGAPVVRRTSTRKTRSLYVASPPLLVMTAHITLPRFCSGQSPPVHQQCPPWQSFSSSRSSSAPSSSAVRQHSTRTSLS